MNYPTFNSFNLNDYLSNAIISSFDNEYLKITKSKRNFANEYQRSLLDISDSNPSYSLLYKIEEFDNNVDSEDVIYKTINSEKNQKLNHYF